MAMIGSLLFALVLWGVIFGVLIVFLYELYMVARDLGWVVDRR